MRSAARKASAPLPQAPLPVDQRLVAEDERYEILEGRVVAVPPSKEPHGERHSKLQALLEIHSAPTYNVACDMLTRTGPVGDVAPDASVYPRERDPETGGRQLEELAFEVLGRQSRSHAGQKADALLGRGVRRVFALEVGRRQVLERRGGRWHALAAGAVIRDRTLSAPLPVRVLTEAARVDDAAARALLAKRNPVLQEHGQQMWQQGERKGKTLGLREGEAKGKAEGLREGEAKGKAEGLREGEAKGKAEGLREGEAKGKAEAVLAVLEVRGLKVSEATRKRVLGCLDLAQLVVWLRRAATVASARALFG